MPIALLSLRELEIVACLFHGKSAKSTALLLGISPHTVNAHSYNIKKKLHVSSKDAIVSCFEKTPYEIYLRDMYINNFHKNQILAILSKLNLSLQHFCLKIHFSNQHTKEVILEFLPQHLVYSGLSSAVHDIKISIKNSCIFLEQLSNSPTLNIKLKESAKAPQNYSQILLEVLQKFCPDGEFSELKTINQPSINTTPQNNEPPQRKKNYYSYVALFILLVGGLVLGWFGTNYFSVAGTEKVNKQCITKWNLPQKRFHHVKRPKLVAKIWDTFVPFSSRIIVTLYGLGGAGKTTLAKHLIHNTKKGKFDLKAWFPAENREILKASYIALGERKELFHRNMSDDLKIEIVREWIANSNSLLVYDNAETLKSLDDFLPPKGQIIITSRNYKFPNAIEVGPMEKEEALDLLNKLIPEDLKNEGNFEKNLKEISSSLGRLPLALSQAGSYIAENVMDLHDFIKLYKTNKESMLAESSLTTGGDDHDSIFITWDMNIQDIKGQQKQGKESLELLDFISYCYSEGIPKKLLAAYIGGADPEVTLNKSLKLLRKHSLISMFSKNISIHRLLHEWISSKHTQMQKRAILQKAIKAIKAIYPQNNKNQNDLNFIRQLIPHTKAILAQLHSPQDKVILLNILGDGYNILGNYNKSNECCEAVLEFSKAIYGKKSPQVSTALYHLGIGKYRLGQIKESNKLLKESLRYIKRNIVQENLILSHISLNYISLGYFKEAKRISEKQLSLLEKKFGVYDIKLLPFLNVLGWSLIYLGQFPKALKIFKKAQSIEENSINSPPTFTLYNMGVVYRKLGLIKCASDYEKKASLRLKNRFGVNHPAYSYQYHLRGQINIYERKYKEAELNINKSLEIRKKTSDIGSVKLSSLHHSLGILKAQDNRLNEATIYFKKAILLTKNSYRGNSEYNITYGISLGNTYRLLKDFNNADRYLTEASEFLRETYGEDHIRFAKAQANIALISATRGNFSDAIQRASKSLSTFQKYLAPEHKYIPQLQKDLEIYDQKKVPNHLGYFAFL